ncbi:hypothetical protein BJX99DRAFT_258849 [Aspergillus californicus]
MAILFGLSVACPTTDRTTDIIKDGQPCRGDGTTGYCESGYCLAEGDHEGVCSAQPETT